MAKRAHLEAWDLSRKCEGCLKPADRRKRIKKFCSDMSRLIAKLLCIFADVEEKKEKRKESLTLIIAPSWAQSIGI